MPAGLIARRRSAPRWTPTCCATRSTFLQLHLRHAWLRHRSAARGVRRQHPARPVRAGRSAPRRGAGGAAVAADCTGHPGARPVELWSRGAPGPHCRGRFVRHRSARAAGNGAQRPRPPGRPWAVEPARGRLGGSGAGDRRLALGPAPCGGRFLGCGQQRHLARFPAQSQAVRGLQPRRAPGPVRQLGQGLPQQRRARHGDHRRSARWRHARRPGHAPGGRPRARGGPAPQVERPAGHHGRPVVAAAGLRTGLRRRRRHDRSRALLGPARAGSDGKLASGARVGGGRPTCRCRAPGSPIPIRRETASPARCRGSHRSASPG